MNVNHRNKEQFKDHLSWYRDSHYKDNMAMRLSYLYNDHPYIDKTEYLYWWPSEPHFNMKTALPGRVIANTQIRDYLYLMIRVPLLVRKHLDYSIMAYLIWRDFTIAWYSPTNKNILHIPLEIFSTMTINLIQVPTIEVCCINITCIGIFDPIIPGLPH